MFDNAGEKIQNYARVYLWVATIIEAIAGAKISEEHPILGFIIGAVIGFVMNYLICLLMYAFGELTEKVERMHTNLYQLAADIKEENHNRSLLENGGWKCNFCGRINADYVTTCTCGKRKNNN